MTIADDFRQEARKALIEDGCFQIPPAVWERLLARVEKMEAVVEAARRVVILEYDPRRTDAENDELQRRGKAWRVALAALDRDEAEA